MVYKVGLALVCGICTGCMSPLLRCCIDVALSRREDSTVPQPRPDIAATVLTLDHQGLLAVVWPPLGEPSRGFLGLQGAPAWSR
jgi:hypothetical protein